VGRGLPSTTSVSGRFGTVTLGKELRKDITMRANVVGDYTGESEADEMGPATRRSGQPTHVSAFRMVRSVRL